jgi:hypothetical protein
MEEDTMMSLSRVALRSLVLGSIVTAVGCGGEAGIAEDTDSTEQADSVVCEQFECEWEASSAWVKLGQQAVDGLYDHDSFNVNPNLGRFTRMQLRIREGGVNIHDVDVDFRDGGSWYPNFDHQYREGERSQVEYLPGTRRIARISITHSKLIFGSGSVVEFWARR